MVWFHHIKALEKRKFIVSRARDLGVRGYSKPGFPGGRGSTCTMLLAGMVEAPCLVQDGVCSAVACERSGLRQAACADQLLMPHVAAHLAHLLVAACRHC